MSMNTRLTTVRNPAKTGNELAFKDLEASMMADMTAANCSAGMAACGTGACEEFEA